MRVLLGVGFLVFFAFFLFAESTKIEEMKNDVQKKYQYVLDIQGKIKMLVERAKKEKDIKWKLCLDDTYATIKGIVASVKSSKERMEDLLKLGRIEAAKSQKVIIDGLVDSANKIYGEANSCPRQLTKINTNLEVDKEEDVAKTGYGETIDDVMGLSFAKEFEPFGIGEEAPEDSGGAKENPVSLETVEEIIIPSDNYASPS